MNVDYVATDWGTVGARRASKEPSDKGGWNIFHTWHAGADCVNPAPYTAFDTSGDTAWFGWPKSDAGAGQDRRVVRRAPTWRPRRRRSRELNKAAMDFVIFVPTGFFKGYQAWRKNVTGVVKAPFPVFWDVTKS